MPRPILAAAVVMFIAGPAIAQKPTDNDKLPGEVWTFEAGKGELSRKGEFRTHDKKVYIVERNIGTISVKGDEATLIVRGNPT